MYSFGGRTDSPFNSMGLIDDGEQNCSDISRRNTPRIAYWSYKKLAAYTDNLVAVPSGTVAGVHDGSSLFAYDYLRREDNSHLFSIAGRDNGNVTLPASGVRYHVTNLIPDRFGNYQESDITPVTGSITLPVGSDPLLVTVSQVPAVTMIAVISPNGRESLATGSTTRITWEAPSSAIKFDLQYTLNGGKTWKAKCLKRHRHRLRLDSAASEIEQIEMSHKNSRSRCRRLSGRLRPVRCAFHHRSA